jgi:2-polyprenyl-3-methyl-5-hydroxy-6-metoxy-1,4-benzoquinol methylase
MSYATLDELRSQLGSVKTPAQSAAYADKMLHPLPHASTVERVPFILERCTGKRVLEFGASGPLTDELKKAAADYCGFDRTDGERIIGLDLDNVDVQALPDVFADVIVCGEVLEHLSNPGHFLRRLREYSVPVIITVPNAFSTVGKKHLQRGLENVNIDHVAWYSPRTLKTLLERHGFAIKEFYYYNGDGWAAEGLIVVTE